MALFAHTEGAEGQPATNDLVARLLVPDIGPVSISGYFAKLGFGELEDLASPKEAVVVGSIRWAATDYFYVEGKVTNEWWLAPDSASYDTTLNFDFGVGFLLNI